MGNPDNKIADIVEIFKSWIPRRSETVNVSRDFWMPDQSCRVCYECDSPFTVFNRKHHCRLCGRVFCAKCTVNSIPVPQQNESRSCGEDWERVRVCNYCFKQWKQETNGVDNGITESNHVANTSPGLSPSPSAISLASTKSSCTCNSSSSTAGSIPHSTGPYQRVECSSGVHHQQSSLIDATMVGQDDAAAERSTNPSAAALGSSPDQFGFFTNKSDDEDDDYGDFQTVSRPRHVLHADGYYGPLTMDQIDHIYQSRDALEEGNHVDTKNISFSSLDESFSSQAVDRTQNTGEEAKDHSADECDTHTYALEPAKTEPVDFENNGLLWLPPEPEDEDDDREAALFDDDDDGESASGEWGYLRPSNSFGGGEYRSRDKSSEEHKRALKSVVEGHFKALIAQLLQVENIPVGEEDDKESWLEIITSLSWEAATLLKPDTSKGGGMDPGGYVKVKCLARGRRSESIVIKGVVCKKNVAHRRMKTKVDKPRFLILGGALEYQRVSNLLSSVDTLLQQEMDHLKMAVAKIAAHHPNVLLVEKSVSRYAQEYLLAKDISLVLNIKRPLLERIARCTGAQMVPSIDHLTSPKLGHCDLFHVEKFLEEHGSAGQGGKKLTKTLMSFEGCPKPLGYTILLKGANGDELKKLKHVIQYGVFAAYHLALETSFLADEGATLPELPLKSPITVALPDKLSSIDRSISTIPGFTVPGLEKPSGSQHTDEVQKVDKGSGQVPKSSDAVFSDISSSINVNCSSEGVDSTCFSENPSSQTIFLTHTLSSIRRTGFLTSLSPSGQDTSSPSHNKSSSDAVAEKDNKMVPHESFQLENTSTNVGFCDYSISSSGASLGLDEGASYIDGLRANLHATSMLSLKKDGMDHTQERGLTKEDFPPSPSDHQSILVSLSTRCVWKGTVCDRAHLFRIKYYGTFDKPLGRFLRDHLFDQDYRCRSCDMPSEAHVYCYTHRQGSLTISIKKSQEFQLPKEKEGKIWMWHRCLRCPRENGFPPATRRVVMSDAAWGLSFGKFLELSFSNHAAASRVASCGHTLHRDCLRFYGFGKMVACFRYASISVHSVYLPPQKLEFSYAKQDWIEKEANEVRCEAELLFTEVRNVLQSMCEKIVGERFQDGNVKVPELSRLHVLELEGMLEKEKEEFEESLRKMLSRKVKLGQHAVDILELNKLRRQILLHSYVWDQRLIHAATLSNTSFLRGQKGLVSYAREKGVDSMEKLAEITTSRSGKGFTGCDSFLESKPEMDFSHGGHDRLLSHSGGDYRERDRDFDLNPRKVENCFSSSQNMNNGTDCLDSGKVVRRIQSEGEFSNMGNLSDTLDAAWTGKSNSGRMIVNENSLTLPGYIAVSTYQETENLIVDKGGNEAFHSPGAQIKRANSAQNFSSCSVMSFPNSYSWLHRSSSLNGQKLCIGDYSPVYISCFKELERQSGARLLLPVGVNDVFVPVYDDEPTSIVAYALLSSDYHVQLSELEKSKECVEVAMPLPHCDQVNPPSANNFDDSASDSYRSIGSTNESTLSISGSRGSQSFDPLLFTKDLHIRVSFTDDGPLGKVKYTVTCYYAKCFEALRKICCPSELDFIRSLSRCKKWGAQGGKSNVFFAKTLDDRFIIKQVTKTELESFIKFGPSYFKYLSESISTRSPTCLAKILGIYQVLLKNVKSGKESKMDILVMENLLFRRNITRVYDLKGSSRSRYNSDTSGSNKVLLDQNLIEAMPTSPIFVGNKAKRLLERAVWNDTSFLALVDVMDYSLLVGVDEEKHELVLGIIDFMRQYTWDKHLETWVKASGILGGSKNAPPTVISPQQYKKRFRKAMTAYFLMVPDQWSTPTVVPSESQSDLCEEKLQTASSMD